MHPGAAKLHMKAIAILTPGAPTQPVTGFQNEHFETPFLQITGCCDAGETTANHNHINRSSHETFSGIKGKIKS